MKHKSIVTFHLIIIMSIFVFHAPAQDNDSIPKSLVLTSDELKSGTTVYPWRFHQGDNPEWASPTYDDTEWEYMGTLGTLLPKDEQSDNSWGGIGWFRLHISVPDQRLWNTPLALNTVYQDGASEIYLDGELIYEFGKVATQKQDEKPYWERNPQGITFSGQTEHVIAVRYSNFSSYQSIPALGFWFVIAPLKESIKVRVDIVRHGTTLQMVWTAICVYLMLQHLLLYLFFPRAKENLYFAISTGSIGAFVYLIFQFVLLATSAIQLRNLMTLLVFVYVLMFLSGLLFLYKLFYSKKPKIYYLLLVGWIFTILIIWFDVNNYTFSFLKNTSFTFNTGLTALLLILGTIFTLLEMARVIFVAIVKKKDGAWIFGLGSLSPFILPIALSLFIARTGFTISWQWGILIIVLAPLFSMSVYLARNFSRTTRKLETEELERQLLEVENNRKTEELEAARELQMSMLPQEPPQIPYLDVEFEMHPATEVGGDYYDYNLTENGKLTIAIGDATGHGMNAGLIVSAVKSLFKTTKPGTGNAETLERISQGIKSMNLKRLYMAMTLATFEDNKLTLTGAGMPPVLISRANEDSVEEILLEGMPLGGGIGSEREELSFDVQPGDTLLLMSDGLPEMLNHKDQMLDYPKTKELFTEVADQNPKEIIQHLFKASTKWARGRPSEDDVTLVVIKVKQPENHLAQQDKNE